MSAIATANGSTNGKHKSIEVTNIGAVKHASIPYLPEGGIVVLKGPQGAGKSTVLDAIDSAVTGKGKPPVRDRELHGELSGFGVTLKVGRRMGISGEPEVHALEGRLSVADLVDPGIAAPEAADARRIKALVSLAGANPDPSIFHELLGGREQFETVVKSAVAELTDLPAIAEKVKRDCEAAAREAESRAEHAEGHARGQREAAAGIDTTEESDPRALQAALEDAIRAESKLREQSAAAKKAQGQAKVASAKIDDAAAEYDGPDVELAKHQEAVARQTLDAALHEVEEAKAKLAQAIDTAAKARNDAERAKLVHQNAKRHADLVAECRQQIEAAADVVVPSDDDLERASEAVASARQAVERGAIIRQAKESLAKSELSLAEAQDHRKRAMELRHAARGTDNVLSEVVAKLGTPLRVEAGRLVIDTPERGKTFFSELSDGQRWRLALDIAIDAVGPHGLIVIPQWAWGELQPKNKRAIGDRLRERGALAYTAEATDDEELTAQVY